MMQRIAATILLFFLSPALFASSCYGRMTNPITDVCWTCIFPISLGSMTVRGGSDGVDTKNPSSPVCVCPGNPVPRVGLSIGFWEPARLVDVTYTPFCFVNLGGITMSPGDFAGSGTHKVEAGRPTRSFYHVHWYHYPALFWLELLLFVTCIETGDFDLAYMTEFDPMWNDDSLAFFLNPEAALFGNLAAQASCSADCISSSTGGLPIDSLYWCGGCQGSMYPLTGNVAHHIGAIQASTLMVQRMTFKLHREGFLPGTMGEKALCEKYKMPIMSKSQYKSQMTYPIAGNKLSSKYACHPYGRTTTLWESGKSFPIKGEDFGYLVWRKRNCCAF